MMKSICDNQEHIGNDHIQEDQLLIVVWNNMLIQKICSLNVYDGLNHIGTLTSSEINEFIGIDKDSTIRSHKLNFTIGSLMAINKSEQL